MVMMTSVTQAGISFLKIRDCGSAAYSLMPESSIDQCHRIGTNDSSVRCESQIFHHR